jgi:DNA-binding NarL/FixJ family response regulator
VGPNGRLRCMIVDDNAEFRAAAATLLEMQGIAVLGAASTSAEALQLVEELRPDVTLVDVNLGAENGFNLVEKLHRRQSTAILISSAYSHHDLADLVSASPAVGYLAKWDLSSTAICNLLRARA